MSAISGFFDIIIDELESLRFIAQVSLPGRETRSRPPFWEDQVSSYEGELRLIVLPLGLGFRV